MAAVAPTTELKYLDRGDGSPRLGYIVHNANSTAMPLVMVMGLSGVKEDWAGFDALLAADRPVLVLDNRGVGTSAVPSDPWTLADMAADVYAIVRSLGWTRVHLFGVSMGGMIAQTFALAYPAVVDRLVLGCTHPGGRQITPPVQEFMDLFQPDALQRCGGVHGFARVMAELNLTPAYCAAHPDAVAALIARNLAFKRPMRSTMNQLQAIIKFDLRSQIAGIKSPTLVIHGSLDSVVPLKNGQDIAALIPGCSIHTLADAGHMFWTQPPHDADAARVIRQFLVARSKL